MIDYIALSALILSTISLLIAYYLLLRKKSYKKNEGKAAISGQRERLESHIYDLNKTMFSEPERLFDNTKLLLQHPNKNLEVNHSVPNYSFFLDLGIDIVDVSIKDKTVFCLMPFHYMFNEMYNTIKMSCEIADYTCSRSDTPYNPGNLLKQIVQSLLESQVIIAVLDGKNPNVFYEIGIAHSIGKTVILIANLKEMEKIPFNLQSNRLLLYSDYNDLKEKLVNTLNYIHFLC